MNETNEPPIVSFVLATYNRPEDLTEAVESVLEQHYRPIEVIVVSSSTDGAADRFEHGGRFDEDFVHYLHVDERVGVPEARNIGYDHASGEFVVTIDDDATLKDPEATDRLVSLFREHEDVGIVAFQSRNYDTGELIRMEIPDPPTFGTPPTEPYRTSCFIGVGNAIRRSAFRAAGPYPGHFRYGFEEMDLSLRVIDAGYDILYAPSIAVYHKNSPEGRLPDAETEQRRIENRIKLAVRNLPWRYVLFTTLLWSGYWLARSGLDVVALGRILRRVVEQRRVLLDERRVIDRETIALLKSRRSMLFFWWYGPDPRRIVRDPNWDLRRRLTW